jgi:hypothetical protein
LGHPLLLPLGDRDRTLLRRLRRLRRRRRSRRRRWRRLLLLLLLLLLRLLRRPALGRGLARFRSRRRGGGIAVVAAAARAPGPSDVPLRLACHFAIPCRLPVRHP